MAREEGVQSGLPPQLLLYQMAIGHYVSHALHVAVKLGIADQLKDGPRDAGELARATTTHAPSLARVLRLLASVGVFEEREDGRFALTSIGECLRTDVPGSSGPMVSVFTGPKMQDAWKELEHCVRTGEPAYRKRGVDDPFSRRDTEESATFDAAMAYFTRMVAVAVAVSYDFKPFRTIVDVGGGTGALMIGILNANPHLQGIVFDLPASAGRATAELAREGLADRCRAVGGDFFEAVPGGGDAYISKHVIHDWDDDRALLILRNCHRVMAPGAKLLLVEGVYPARIDQSRESRGAAANDVNMLVNTGGRQRSEAEFRFLYEAAGFDLTRIVPTPGPVSVIEGTRR